MARTREHGALESRVLEILRALDRSASAADIREHFDEPKPALTTLLTVLERLRVKGAIQREELSPRKVRFTPTLSAEEDAGSVMMHALDGVPDRRAALLHFAGNLDGEDLAFLRRALSKGAPE
ncbi:BlaI/MecI/CopY family transcriptional regulator [Tessaracoccus caeni]|uniref:BlaI/MecI/CopY family transcriptional regulator n=1 Tax=Tessaracoccus caeni TaxID=3031239 RepID=UPI0023DA814C|nr:BlaI/MecI/CopY family transcriptional regulator [Tessaracoccus caeni]MDF1489840.1 BlaI/MecI/CopY family transcriptional regulator [Tessaracoccus caeni]